MGIKNPPTKKIFISYRVQDTAGETGRLVDALKQYFSDDQIFMDIENLEPGADFTESIERSLSTCDVFLAVIGPRWIGDRDKEPRINNPNDWVRLEVGTALRRNIRVVPVLVDGASLPASEQLPEDLQPLLRRQSIEITNKRWRYDTDQLISFLVRTAGIPPKRATEQKAAISSASSGKKKTWVYIAAGFALCMLVLVVVGLIMQEEKKENGTQTQTGNSPSTQNASSGTGASVPTKEATGSEGDDLSTAAPTISGTWDEVDEGQTTTMLMTQSGSQVNVEAQTGGQVIGSGNGTTAGRNVDLNVALFGIAYTIHLVLSGDGNTLSGTYFVPATGITQQVKLVRRR